MATADHDYILRMITEFAAFLRRVRDLLKLGQAERALEEIRSGSSALVGMDARLFLVLDAPTLVTQLASPEKIAQVASILALQAEVMDSLDEPQQARLLANRALELYLELQLAGTPPHLEGLAEARRLLERLGDSAEDQLPERYRAAARLLRGSAAPSEG